MFKRLFSELFLVVLLFTPAYGMPIVIRNTLLFSSAPIIDWSFMGPTLPSGLTFSRAGDGWYFNSTGTLQKATANNPRFDYDPVTMKPLGLLLEEQRTNSIRNSVFAGGVAGSPGTDPTNMSVSVPTGCSKTLAFGTEYGMPYMDIRIFGTPDATYSSLDFFLETRTATSAATADIWTSSVFARLVGGSLTNLTNLTLCIGEYATGPLYVVGGNNSLVTSIGATLGRFSYIRTLNGGASVATITSYIEYGVTINQPVDFTIRIYQPQLEKGYGATSPIVTNGSAVTRAADSLTCSSIPWFNPSQGAFLAELVTEAISSVNSPRIVSFNDGGTNTNRIGFAIDKTTQKYFGEVKIAGNGTYSSQSSGLVSIGSIAKVSVSYQANNYLTVCNGSNLSISSPSGVPSGLNNLIFGNDVGGNRANMWLRRFCYWNKALPSTRLQQETR